ncbi:hypothetical protein [Xylophilus sp. GOD-11R]|uniref:hypothetical protein n=1 Tax=Xylophilus sp. GOD-11R TaxID=3089814 RepID=UPI00298BD790|nr:hypothetical protein [Xylophilus sp. GOD-11R]WPB55282.1 hypothetical protein R9X41_14110 [Xylophilus sp. GOD-11R]
MSFLPPPLSANATGRHQPVRGAAERATQAIAPADARDADFPASSAGSFLADLPRRAPTIQLRPCEAFLNLFSYEPPDMIELTLRFHELISACAELPRAVPSNRHLSHLLEQLHADVEEMQRRVFSPADRGDGFIKIDRLHTRAQSLQARILRWEEGRQARHDEWRRRIDSGQNLQRAPALKPDYVTDPRSPSGTESLEPAERPSTMRHRRRDLEPRPHPPVREIRAEVG